MRRGLLSHFTKVRATLIRSQAHGGARRICLFLFTLHLNKRFCSLFAFFSFLLFTISSVRDGNRRTFITQS